jgi:hypothetical protein
MLVDGPVSSSGVDIAPQGEALQVLAVPLLLFHLHLLQWQGTLLGSRGA